MDIRKLQRAIVDALEDVKAQDIVVYNTEHLSPLFERVIIASGTSNRQTKALASSVRETVKGRGLQILRTEGEDNGEWIIVDCGAAVAHIMQPAIRQYYRLEEIWGGKPVNVKLGATKGLVKAEELEEDEAPKKKAPARKTLNAAPAKPGKATATAKSAAGKAALEPKVKASAPRKVSAGTAKTAVKTTASKSAAPKAPGRRKAAEPATTVVVLPSGKKVTRAGAKAAAKSAAPKAPRSTATPTKRATPVKAAVKTSAAKPAAKKPVAKKAALKTTVGRKTTK